MYPVRKSFVCPRLGVDTGKSDNFGAVDVVESEGFPGLLEVGREGERVDDIPSWDMLAASEVETFEGERIPLT